MSSPVRLQRPSNLALDAGKPKSRVTFSEESLSQARSTSTTTPSPRKLKYDADFRARRKRAHSCSFYWDHFNNKKRKSGGAIVLPTKFLLGGNITDPLNLEALDKEDDIVNKPQDIFNANYKRSTTVRVIIPPNINDPLNLDACSEDGEEQLADAISRQRRRRKTKKRRRRNSEPGGLNMFPETRRNRLCVSLDDTRTTRTRPDIPAAPIQSEDGTKNSEDISVASDAQTSSASQVSDVASTTSVSNSDKAELIKANESKELSPIKNSGPIAVPQQQQASTSSVQRYLQLKKQRTKSSEDKIVSPVVPQARVERRRHFSHQRHSSTEKSAIPKQTNNRQCPRFQYGNYNQYYGYRNAGHKLDPRLKLLNKEWFEGKEVLDIGCNIGHITLSIGRDFGPQRIVGIDIDKKLVNIAQRNSRHYVDSCSKEDDEFPKSMKLLYGSLKPPVNKGGYRKFPYNVKFYQSNYVLESDALLEIVRPEFDVIVCLSVTKWIHLNWGDDGLKRFFKRIYRNLKPGGMLILEPQAWPSYKKKKKLNNEIFENFKKIQFYPNQFGEYLTSEVGFSSVLKSSVSHISKGFERPIYVYKKNPPGLKSPSVAKEEAEDTLVDLPNQTSSNIQLRIEGTDMTSGSHMLGNVYEKNDEKISELVEETSDSTVPARMPNTDSKILQVASNETEPEAPDGKMQEQVVQEADSSINLKEMTESTVNENQFKQEQFMKNSKKLLKNSSEEQLKINCEEQLKDSSCDEQLKSVSFEEEQLKITRCEELKNSSYEEQLKSSSCEEQLKSSNCEEQLKSSSCEELKNSSYKEQLKSSSCKEQSISSNYEEQLKSSNCEEQLKSSCYKEQLKNNSCEKQSKSSSCEELQNSSCEEQLKSSTCDEHLKSSSDEEQLKSSSCKEQLKNSSCEEQLKNSSCEEQLKTLV